MNLTSTIAHVVDYKSQSNWIVDNSYPIWIDPTHVNYPSTTNPQPYAQNSNIFTDHSLNSKLDGDTIEFLEMVLLAMGVDMSYNQFLLLSPQERKALIRNIKINNITK